MTNYKKLCEECGYYEERLPDFTAEKQIELIKLIGVIDSFTADYSEIAPRNDNEQWGCICLFKVSYNSIFSEALAGLVLQLIEEGELDKEEIRKVL